MYISSYFDSWKPQDEKNLKLGGCDMIRTDQPSDKKIGDVCETTIRTFRLS